MQKDEFAWGPRKILICPHLANRLSPERVRKLLAGGL